MTKRYLLQELRKYRTSPENLEDPGLFDDLVDPGLLSFPDALTIGQSIRAKQLKQQML